LIALRKPQRGALPVYHMIVDWLPGTNSDGAAIYNGGAR